MSNSIMKTLFPFLALILILSISCTKDEEIKTNTVKKSYVITSSRPIVICEQLEDRVIIVDSASQNIVWEWVAALSGLPSSHISWFKHIDEAKPIYNKKYVLVTASYGGGVAIIRISDKKVMFYACPGSNTHSAEILPDGNLVVACSTSETAPNANSLLIYKVDTLSSPAGSYVAKYTVYSAHNAVWDYQRQLLMATTSSTLNYYKYNFDGVHPSLTLQETVKLPASGSHDLFPVYGEDALWLTNAVGVYKYDIATKTAVQVSFSLPTIKCVSSGPAGYGTLLVQPKKDYYTDEVINSDFKRVFYGTNYRIYKARWFIDNPFSYGGGSDFKQP